jgi:hypothetical protein
MISKINKVFPRGDFKMSDFEIATLDLREKPGFLAGFSKSISRN